MAGRLPRVICPLCDKQTTANPDGEVRRHDRFRDAKITCPGSGQVVTIPDELTASRLAAWATMSEAAWSVQVIGRPFKGRHVGGIASSLRWRVWHDNDPRWNSAGLPDNFLWRPPGRFMAVELKTETGALSVAQHAMLGEWHDCGIEVHVWRPRHAAAAVEALR